MPVDLNELLLGAQAHAISRLGGGFDQDARMMNNVAMREFGQVSPLEAASAKELAKAGIGTDLAGINAGHSTPNPKTA